MQPSLCYLGKLPPRSCSSLIPRLSPFLPLLNETQAQESATAETDMVPSERPFFEPPSQADSSVARCRFCIQDN